MDKLPMIMAVGAVIDFKAKNPGCLDDEAMQHVMRTVKGSGEAKVVAIAGATSALKVLRKNPRATKKEVMQAVMDESDTIVSQIIQQGD